MACAHSSPSQFKLYENDIVGILQQPPQSLQSLQKHLIISDDFKLFGEMQSSCISCNRIDNTVNSPYLVIRYLDIELVNYSKSWFSWSPWWSFETQLTEYILKLLESSWNEVIYQAPYIKFEKYSKDFTRFLNNNIVNPTKLCASLGW